MASANVEAQLRAADMNLNNLVKVRSDRAPAWNPARFVVRSSASTQVALTVIETGIFDAAWLSEIEAIAAA